MFFNRNLDFHKLYCHFRKRGVFFLKIKNNIFEIKIKSNQVAHATTNAGVHKCARVSPSLTCWRIMKGPMLGEHQAPNVAVSPLNTHPDTQRSWPQGVQEPVAAWALCLLTREQWGQSMWLNHLLRLSEDNLLWSFGAVATAPTNVTPWKIVHSEKVERVEGWLSKVSE